MHRVITLQHTHWPLSVQTEENSLLVFVVVVVVVDSEHQPCINSFHLQRHGESSFLSNCFSSVEQRQSFSDSQSVQTYTTKTRLLVCATTWHLSAYQRAAHHSLCDFVSSVEFSEEDVVSWLLVSSSQSNHNDRQSTAQTVWENTDNHLPGHTWEPDIDLNLRQGQTGNSHTGVQTDRCIVRKVFTHR